MFACIVPRKPILKLRISGKIGQKLRRKNCRERPVALRLGFRDEPQGRAAEEGPRGRVGSCPVTPVPVGGLQRKEPHSWFPGNVLCFIVFPKHCF